MLVNEDKAVYNEQSFFLEFTWDKLDSVDVATGRHIEFQPIGDVAVHNVERH